MGNTRTWRNLQLFGFILITTIVATSVSYGFPHSWNSDWRSCVLSLAPSPTLAPSSSSCQQPLRLRTFSPTYSSHAITLGGPHPSPSALWPSWWCIVYEVKALLHMRCINMMVTPYQELRSELSCLSWAFFNIQISVLGGNVLFFNGRGRPLPVATIITIVVSTWIGILGNRSSLFHLRPLT